MKTLHFCFWPKWTKNVSFLFQFLFCEIKCRTSSFHLRCVSSKKNKNNNDKTRKFMRNFILFLENKMSAIFELEYSVLIFVQYISRLRLLSFIKDISFFLCIHNIMWLFAIVHRGDALKVALQILGQKFYKITKKSSSYSQSLVLFIHKTTVVENHPTTRETRDLLRPRSRHRREIQSIFTWAVRSFTYWKYTDEASNIASDEEIIENDYTFVMLSNLRIISHLIFHNAFFFWHKI